MTSTSSSDDFLPLHLKIYETYHDEWGSKTTFGLHFIKNVNGIVESKTDEECDWWFEPSEIKTLNNIKDRLHRYYAFYWRDFVIETIKIQLFNRESKLIDEILWVFETNDIEKDDDEYKDEINRIIKGNLEIIVLMAKKEAREQIQQLDKMAEFIYNTLF